MSEQQAIDTPQNWDAASEGYSTNIAPRLMEVFIQDFIPNLNTNENSRVLEVAAGSGAFTRSLAKSAGRVLATDFSPQMLRINKELTLNQGITNVDFEVMDGQALDLEDSTFDAALCCFGLMLFPDRHRPQAR